MLNNSQKSEADVHQQPGCCHSDSAIFAYLISSLTATGKLFMCRCNVDMLKLIQLGLTFTNADGKLPVCGGELCVWQFNFRCETISGRAALECQLFVIPAFSHAADTMHVCNVHCLSCREFKLSDDMFAQDSIELLKQSGIDFAKMEARGIDVSNFGELLMSSGIVLNEDVSYCQRLEPAVCTILTSCSRDVLSPSDSGFFAIGQVDHLS